MKQLVSLLIVLATLFSLAACKGEDEESKIANLSADTLSEEGVIEGSAEDVDDEDVVVSTVSVANSVVSASSKPSASSKTSETASKPVTSKVSDISKTGSVSKENTTSKESVASKDTTTSKAPVVSKDSAASKAYVASKNSTTSKAPVVSKDSTTSKLNSVVSTVSSLEDFGDKLEESGFETNIKENEDGSITIGLKPSTPDKTEEETPKPVIPVIPSIDDIEEEEEPEIPVVPPVTSLEGVTSESPTDVSTPAASSSAEEAGSTPAPSTSVPSDAPSQKTYYSYTTNQTHTALKNTQSYLYSILTDEQKGWYRKIDAAVNKLEDEVWLDTDLLTNEDYNIYFLYLLDNPEHFYLSNEIGIYGYDSSHGLKLFYAIGTKAGEFTDNNNPLDNNLKQKIISKKATFEAKVEEIISTIPSAAPEVEKEKLIYDKILLNSVYNVEAAYNHPTQGMADDWTAYGVLINGKGVCESYDEAFQCLLRRVGIRSTAIVGTANGGGHKWCEVEIEGNWYMCDITFDDPVGGAANAAYHRYFNLTSGEMASKDKHDWSTNTYNLPPCNASEYSYKNYFKN